LHNEELNDLYSSPNIARVLKSKIMRWARAWGAYGREEGRIQDFDGGNLSGRDHLGDPAVYGRLILRWIFRNWEVGVWTGSRWLRKGTGGGYL